MKRILIAALFVPAVAFADPLWNAFQRNPKMIDNCAVKLASGEAIDRQNGWPAYCNDYENTDVVQNRVSELKQNRSTFPASDQNLIREGKVYIGMSAAAAEASWGKPDRINRSTNASGTREQWVYDGGNYLYIRNGKITNIQH